MDINYLNKRWQNGLTLALSYHYKNDIIKYFIEIIRINIREVKINQNNNRFYV